MAIALVTAWVIVHLTPVSSDRWVRKSCSELHSMSRTPLIVGLSGVLHVFSEIFLQVDTFFAHRPLMFFSIFSSVRGVLT